MKTMQACDDEKTVRLPKLLITEAELERLEHVVQMKKTTKGKCMCACGAGYWAKQ